MMKEGMYQAERDEMGVSVEGEGRERRTTRLGGSLMRGEGPVVNCDIGRVNIGVGVEVGPLRAVTTAKGISSALLLLSPAQKIT